MELIGLLAGLLAGAVQFKLLGRFTAGITGGAPDLKTVLTGLLQFFIPLLVLLGCAFLAAEALVWTGGGLAVSLIGGAVWKYCKNVKASKDRGKKDG